MVKQTSSTENFGYYIRSLREKHKIGQRELAKKIGVAPSYLNDIEKNKRTAPRIELIKKISTILKADFGSYLPESFLYRLSNLFWPDSLNQESSISCASLSKFCCTIFSVFSRRICLVFVC